ncbi:hypothetical protein L1987_18339 [Smallanthus sonchifolius]|uniref:Uncharacterized protein n=1 Tax=Smallanthus sonchifolius TaxID=185202 RepID=A0ACB9J1I6_9ASTR|nr:hypothetical protein L1987_18339 [Smallanthus sonchifolius]
MTAAVNTRVADDLDFVDSLIISPYLSQSTSPHGTPAPLPLPTSSQVSPSSSSKDAKIAALQGKVSCLEAQVVGLQEAVQRNDNEDNDISGNKGDRQYTDVAPISQFQGESTSNQVEASGDKVTGENEEVFLLEFFKEDSDLEEDEKIDCLDGCDGLNVPFDFILDDVIPNVTSDRMADSMDSTEDVTVPDSNPDNAPSKSTEEPVMYKDTGELNKFA